MRAGSLIERIIAARDHWLRLCTKRRDRFIAAMLDG